MKRTSRICLCGGMLALVLSMTPALALNPQPLPPGHEEHPMIVKHPRKPRHTTHPHVTTTPITPHKTPQ